MLPPQGIKSGGERDAHAIAFLWADLDFGELGHKPNPEGLPLPTTAEDARKIIAELPTPTLIVHSGGAFSLAPFPPAA